MIVRILICALALGLGLAGAAAAAEESLPVNQARIAVILDHPGATPFERQMVLATIRGIYFVNISLDELTIPQMPDIEWMQLARETWKEEMIEGRPARVMERRIAFFPQRAGQVTILPVVHRLQLIAPNGERVWHEIRSAPIPIKVMPGLASAGDRWLPLAALEYSDSWNRDAGQLQDGESTERTVVLRALGATAEMLPTQPAMRQPWMITFSRPEKRTTELTPLGPLTTVVWQWTMRPTTGEPGVIPEVRIPWYDTSAGEARMAVLKAAPFGYASFGDNSAGRWRAGFSGIPLIVGAMLLGAFVTAIVLSPGQRVRSREEVGRLLRKCLPDLQKMALRRAARRQDLEAFRRAATLLMARKEITPNMDGWRLVEPVDRCLFGKDTQTRSTPDLRSLAKSILATAAIVADSVSDTRPQ